MILCVQIDGGRVYFDGFDRVEHRAVDRPANVGYQGGDIDFRPQQEGLIAPAKDDVEISLFKGGVFTERILSVRPVYLENDRGETIARI